ncbi:acyltransferase [Entomoplasma ellychniae]|uniref:Acyltransferase n=1 Tax=Entomoplasma ellychniae TaxID=2114 RepID=A0A8E2QVK3_9MOLU|nr:GNAT family N-acetyltransferase [Entomoplasma ellychniae]PPE04481.1 acyltransferase [Entomoplasma ellychniae]
MKKQIKTYNELTPKEIWDIFKLRTEVFNVEQQFIISDIDENDLISHHLTFRNEDDELIAYLRIYLENGHSTLGRIVVPLKFRSNNYGKMLVQAGIDACLEKYPDLELEIHARDYLKRFYESLGFVSTSEPHMFDGAPHRFMKMDYSKNQKLKTK